MAVALIVALGVFIFYNTNVLNEYLSPMEAGRPHAEYERRYARYKDLPQPVVAGADLRFEIYPEKYAVDMRGSYKLVNETGAPIGAVHVETPRGPDYEVRSMTFDGGAKPQVIDREHGYRIFALQRPLAPGDSTRFSFDVALRPRGFPHGGWQTAVVRNGSYFDRGTVERPFGKLRAGCGAAGPSSPAASIQPRSDDRRHEGVARLLHVGLRETITLWDVKTQRAVARGMPDGKYEVILDLVAQKMRADSIGVETATPMKDFVEVGVFAPGKDEAIYLARHRIRSGKQTICIIVPQEPSRAGVDPYRKLIERERGDNVVGVQKRGVKQAAD